MSTLETERMILRPLTEADASQQYADWLNDPEVNQFLETRHFAQTVESCRAFIQQCNADPGSYLLGVFLKETGQHIGNVKVGFINSYYQRGQVSLFIGEKTFWGHGLSSELVRKVTRFAFEDLGLNRLEAGCYENNLASLRVFLKCGYTVEGFMREQVTLNGKRMGVFWLGMIKHEYN
ncbi:MAG: GNAT family protein [Pseudoalteromonas distincta]